MSELQALFTEAVNLHHQKRLAEAEKLYLQVLQSVPENINVLANLGIVARDLGKLEEAELICRKTIALAPDDAAQYVNLGAVMEARDDYTGAEAAYEKALELCPSHPKALNNLGKLLHQQGLAARGLELLEYAIRVEPEYPLALNNLGVIYSERGDLAKSAECLEKSITLDPDNVHILYNLAGICNAQNNHPRAKTILNRLLAIDPQHQAATHMLAALSGTTTISAPREYVEETFNKYAHRFDRHIQDALGYTVPVMLAEVVRKNLSTILPFSAALDLGCGTGLSGLPFKGLTNRLVGVDVSLQMLQKAKEKHIYDRLEHDDILSFLERDNECYGLCIAADVFVYLGELKRFFLVLAARTSNPGIVACSIERTGVATGYELLSSGRYAHHPEYLENCAAAAGFHVLHHQSHNIRKEEGKWLPGDIYLLRYADRK